MKKLVVKPVALISIFNEAQQTETLIREILSTKEEIDVLVVDGDSPDGTAALAEKIP
jgi:glycosyltransferase involved in cell wall biosynthesis